jgi:hypothetical protein
MKWITIISMRLCKKNCEEYICTQFYDKISEIHRTIEHRELLNITHRNYRMGKHAYSQHFFFELL